jgi:SAM-dependent methyltransferase
MNRKSRYRIKRFLPEWTISQVVKWRSNIYVLRSLGGRYPRKCPICQFYGYFRPCGTQPVVIDGGCPVCRSAGRHRQHHLLVARHPEWIDDKCLLHVSPEPCFVQEYAARAKTYVRGDYDPAHDEVKIDLQTIDYPDALFDLVICHNVIEHIPDDRRALEEIYRVLRPGGVAILSAPMIDAWDHTYENPAVITAMERELHFAQEDHYRIYGRDLYDRIRAAGFDLAVDIAQEPAVHQYALERGETIFIASKPK